MTQLALPLCQRWLHRRPRYRPPQETIDPRQYGVEPLTDRWAAARAFVETHHYSGSWPAVRFPVGLFRVRPLQRPELVGVALFSQPMQQAAIPRWTGLAADEGIDLGRFVLSQDVPAMGETWFLARAFRLLSTAKPALRAVIAYSDPTPRVTAAGEAFKPGHIGTIYAAHNAAYLGRGRARTLLLCPDGTALQERALSKIRGDERGGDGAQDRLEALGAPSRHRGESGASYLRRALPALQLRRWPTRGNHVFAWPLGHGNLGLRSTWRTLPRPLFADPVPTGTPYQPERAA